MWSKVERSEVYNEKKFKTLHIVYSIATNGMNKADLAGIAKKFQDKCKIGRMAKDMIGYSHRVIVEKRLATSYVSLFFKESVDDIAIELIVDFIGSFKTKTAVFSLDNSQPPVAYYKSAEDFHMPKVEIEKLNRAAISVNKSSSRINGKARTETESVLKSTKESGIEVDSRTESPSVKHQDKTLAELNECGEFTRFQLECKDAYDSTVFTKREGDHVFEFGYDDASDNRDVQRWLFALGHTSDTGRMYQDLKKKLSPDELRNLLRSHLKRSKTCLLYTSPSPRDS